MMRRLALCLLIGCAAGCGGASADPGLAAYLRLSGAQYVPGGLSPQSDATAPLVTSVNLLTTKVAPGLQNLPLSGDVHNGSSVLVGLAGDTGHWIVPATVADFQMPGDFLFQTKMSLSPEVPPGKQTLLLRGVDAQGIVGPAQQLDLDVSPAVPTGALVISLVWDTEADLDLHVLAPNPIDPSTPIEIWSKAPVGLPPHVAGTATADGRGPDRRRRGRRQAGLRFERELHHRRAPPRRRRVRGWSAAGRLHGAGRCVLIVRTAGCAVAGDCRAGRRNSGGFRAVGSNGHRHARQPQRRRRTHGVHVSHLLSRSRKGKEP